MSSSPIPVERPLPRSNGLFFVQSREWPEGPRIQRISYVHVNCASARSRQVNALERSPAGLVPGFFTRNDRLERPMSCRPTSKSGGRAAARGSFEIVATWTICRQYGIPALRRDALFGRRQWPKRWFLPSEPSLPGLYSGRSLVELRCAFRPIWT